MIVRHLFDCSVKKSSISFASFVMQQILESLVKRTWITPYEGDMLQICLLCCILSLLLKVRICDDADKP